MKRIKRKFAQLTQAIAYHYPLSFMGSLLFLVNLSIFGRAIAERNPYNWLLSAIILFLVSCLIIAGKLQAFKAGKSKVEWESSDSVYAAALCSTQEISFQDSVLLPFYRKHCSIRGRQKVGRDAYLALYQDCSSRGEDSIHVPLYVPFCGVLDTASRLMIKDIFGITRNRFGKVLRREMLIKPALLNSRENHAIHAMNGMEGKNKKRESEEERYFMREYIPGDRFRDINWKASSRFSELFSRIAPPTQEETHIITVIMRPFSPQSTESLTSIVHLNYLKSRLLFFIKSIRQVHPAYQFQVHSGIEQIIVSTDEDLEKLGAFLCNLFFQNPPALTDDPIPKTSGPIFIFTTPYDTTLHTALAARSPTEARIFTTAFSGRKAKQGFTDIAVFKLSPTFALPGSWFFRKNSKRAMGISELGDGSMVIRDILNISWFGFSGMDANNE